MHITQGSTPGEHKVYLNDKIEAFRVARAIGIWRYSGLKIVAAAFTGEVGFRIDTVNLETIDKALDPPSMGLKTYLGSLAINEQPVFVPETADAVSTAAA